MPARVGFWERLDARLGWSVPARLLRWLMGAAITVALFRLLAGRWDVPWLWAMAAVASLLGLGLNLTIDPGLVRERRRPGPGGLDRKTNRLMGSVIAAQVVVAALDAGRFHWSDTVPASLHLVGLALFTVGFGLVTWAAGVNRFFSSVVRVQAERGHQLVTAGPYAYVRHPGYLGMLLAYPTIAPAIGSWWAMIASAATVFIILRRLRIEDAHLVSHLPGYPAYAARVPYRLVPGVW